LMMIHKFDRDANISYATLMREAFEATVKLAKTMERELGEEKAHEIIYMSRVEGDLVMIAHQLEEQQPIQNFAEFKKLMKRLHENQFAGNLFTITYPIDNDHEIEFMTTECILAKVFRDMCAEDLGEIMCCKPDFDTTPAYCRRVSLKRTKSLMKGDAYCDTKYCWK
jgi:L-2-amino-thiazoline-4-carboxylic acid hydrolase